MKKLFLVLLICAIFSGQIFASGKAPVFAQDSSQKVKNEYIVVLKEGVSAELEARDMARVYKGQVKHIYKKALNGFSVRLTDKQLERMRENPLIDFIEANQTVSINMSRPPASWGQDRIDQRDLPLNDKYVYINEGEGIHAYVIDTGVRTTHSEFTGRVGNGYSAIAGGYQDCHGHGTHVAGTMAGSNYGIATKATIHPVRVLNCYGNGTYAEIIAGVDWVRLNHVKPAVANMSLGGAGSAAMDAAVENLVASGVTVVVAAGNSRIDACYFSPARTPNAITVGSTTMSDRRSLFSNYGSCVDVFAPGSGIKSAWSTSNTATNTISGTSMASPHVAGVAALYLEENPAATPAQVAVGIIETGLVNRLEDARVGSPNLMAYSFLRVDPDPPPPLPSPSGIVPSITTLYSEFTGCNYTQARYRVDWSATSDSTIYEYELDALVGGSYWTTYYYGLSSVFDIAVDTGTNQVRVRARNASGWSAYKQAGLGGINCGGGPIHPY